MDLGDVVAVVVPILTALTGLVSAIASLMVSRRDLQTIAHEAARTGLQPAPGITTVAVDLARELATARAELAQPRHRKR